MAASSRAPGLEDIHRPVLVAQRWSPPPQYVEARLAEAAALVQSEQVQQALIGAEKDMLIINQAALAASHLTSAAALTEVSMKQLQRALRAVGREEHTAIAMSIALKRAFPGPGPAPRQAPPAPAAVAAAPAAPAPAAGAPVPPPMQPGVPGQDQVPVVAAAPSTPPPPPARPAAQGPVRAAATTPELAPLAPTTPPDKEDHSWSAWWYVRLARLLGIKEWREWYASEHERLLKKES